MLMLTAPKPLAEAHELPGADGEDVAAQPIHSGELPAGISIENEAEIRRRVQQARDRVAGLPWSEAKRSLQK
jgi:hypothetical protein